MGNVLVFSTEPDGAPVQQAASLLATAPVTWLEADRRAPEHSLPASWVRLVPSELLDNEQLCQDVLSFVRRWPAQPDSRGHSFDDLFRRSDGYSVWWTSVGLERDSGEPLFEALRKLWLFDRAIRRVAARRVVLYCRDPVLLFAIQSRCRKEGIAISYLADSVGVAAKPWRGQWKWFLAGLAWLVATVWFMALRALLARCVVRPARDTAAEQRRAVLLLTGLFPAGLLNRQYPVAFYCWQNLYEALAALRPDVRVKHLPMTTPDLRHGFRMVTPFFNTGWRWLSRRGEVAALPEGFVCWKVWLASVVPQVMALVRYARFERDPRVRQSFEFAGADLAAIYVPKLRRAVARMAGWTRYVAALERAIRGAGNVRGVLVENEFYERGAMVIAAAKRLGIPIIGAQHGTTYPMHLTYRLPPEQVQGAPMPDYFAAYGEFSKEVVSRLGAYPASRVWPIGGWRFDHLARGGIDSAAARHRLGLPSGRRIILVTTQNFAWFGRAVQAVFAAAREHPQWLVCVKRHPLALFGTPRDSLDEYQRLAGSVGLADARFFDEHMEDLLAAADVLVSGSSTTLLEAVVAGKPTVCVNFSDEDDWYPYSQDGGSLPGRTADQVRISLERCFEPAAQRELAATRTRFLERHVGMAAEGRAAPAFAEQIAVACGLHE